jgi:hypothetical protein
MGDTKGIFEMPRFERTEPNAPWDRDVPITSLPPETRQKQAFGLATGK